MVKMDWIAAGLFAASVLVSCGSGKDFRTASAAVEQFHRQIAAEQDDAIYDAADARWKQAIDRQTSHKFFSRLRRRMGNCFQATNSSYRINFTTSGTFVNLQYATKCDQGNLDENFSWHISDGKAYLVAYNANSPLLLTD